MRHNELRLAKEVHRLSKMLIKLEKQQPFEIMRHRGRFLWFAFLKGLMIGFGSFIGATLLVALLVFILSKIQFVPIIGDFVQQIMQEIGKAK